MKDLSNRDIAIAIGFAELGEGVPDNTPAGPLLEAFKRAVEAYEAALPDPWRPIEEAPFGLPIILSLPSGITLPQGMDSDPVYLVAVKHETGLWDQRTGHLWDSDDLKYAMFRTIDPPQKG